ncbi:MAG: hypothetical protein DMF86_07240 [Acidobacteria bacterium]|nr:MAG: hypothetical protein DMF86_07240 [Acidobacteriota bacterium]
MAKAATPARSRSSFDVAQADPEALEGSAASRLARAAGDVHHAGPDLPADPDAYLPLAQDAWSDMTIVARTDGDLSATGASLGAIVRSLDRDRPLSRVRSMDAVVRDRVAPRRLAMLLLGVFAALALLLALLGIYGVMGYVVSQRTNEIGVRMALGAHRAAILKMILGEGARLGIAGLTLGVVLSLAATRLVETALFGITPTDAPTYGTVVMVMLAVVLAACDLPARRAARVDPLSAIRME